MVLKPTEKTPLAALVLADVLYEAGLPPPMLSVITGDPNEIADEMITNAGRRSRHVHRRRGDRQVHRRRRRATSAWCSSSAATIRSIVMEDADPAKAAALAAQGSYKNSGQRCTAVKRILVHEKIADAFVEALVDQTQEMVLRRSARPQGRHGHGDQRGRRQAVRAPRERRLQPRRQAAGRQQAQWRARIRRRWSTASRRTWSWCARRRSGRCRRCCGSGTSTRPFAW